MKRGWAGLALAEVLLLAALSGRARAESDPLWLHWELGRIGLGNSVTDFQLGDFSVYLARYGLGAGLGLGAAKWGAWDVHRTGANDVAGKFVSTWFPLRAYATLYSFEGWPAYLGRDAWRTVGRLEAYGEYSNWAKFGMFNTEDDPETQVAGSVGARYVEYGLRLDMGSKLTFTAGRFEFQSRAYQGFQPRYAATWFGRVSVYFGWTTGTVSGGLYQIPADIWGGLRSLFHRRFKPDDTIIQR